MAVNNVSMDVHVKFGYARSNGSRDVRGADLVSIEQMNMIEAFHLKIILT